MATNQVYGDSTTIGRNTSSATSVWAGRIISGFVTLFLLVDAIPKLLEMEFAVDATVEAGYPASTVVWIGLILLVCTVLYTVPRTAVLGTVLLTGYLGGAVATQVRIESPDVLFAIVFGALVWVGAYLRDERVRALVKV